MMIDNHIQGGRLARSVWPGAALLVSLICLLGVAACDDGGSSKARASYEPISQVVLQTRPLLLPPIEGSVGGWCLAIEPGSCEAARAFRGPIVAQGGGGQGPPAVQIGIVLTTNEVAGVSVDGGATIPTRSDSMLPDHLRAAVVEVRGGPRVTVPGFGVGPRPLSFTPLNSKGEAIRQKIEPQGSLFFVVPRRHWSGPAKAPVGPCEIHVTHLPGLTVQRGVVVDRISSHSGLPAQPLLSCVSTSFSLKGDSLIASVLIDAAHPGTTPRSLPAMKPLSAHPGVFEALGGSVGGLGDSGQILARRTSGAWLVVANGSGNAQRLTLLEHLRATVRL